jgi:FkbM family methyltransferase
MQYYGQFTPPVDEIIHERYFPTLENGIGIECGAFDGVTESCTYFFNKNKGWTTFNIEAVPNIFKKLQQNRTDSKSININVALSSEDCQQIIRNYKHPSLGYDWGNASINHTPTHRNQLEQLSGNQFIEHPVKCITYKSLIKEYNIDHLDLFVLDVEGHETSVLRGMQGCDVLPSVFVIEHGHTPVDLTPYFGDTYRLDYVSDVNSFFIKN